MTVKQLIAILERFDEDNFKVMVPNPEDKDILEDAKVFHVVPFLGKDKTPCLVITDAYGWAYEIEINKDIK